MKSLISIASLFACAAVGFAQPAKVTSNSVTVDGNTLDLPEIRLASPEATERANYYVEALMLGEIVSPKSLAKLIASSTASEGKSGLTSLSWKVVRNDGLLLSLYFQGEAMGAYPSSFERSITLDASSGISVTGRDLFTPAGYDSVFALVIRDRRAMVQADTAGLPHDSTRELDAFDVNMMYDCADNASLDPILVTDSTISPTEMRCLPHADQALDIDWSLPLPIKQVASDLNAYGRAVLIQHTNIGFTPSDSDRFMIYRGTIGTSPITMMIERTDDPEFGGSNVHYFYDGRPATLEMGGSLSGNSFEVESYKAGAVDEKFVGIRRSGVITGTWRKGKKRLPFELKPY